MASRASWSGSGSSRLRGNQSRRAASLTSPTPGSIRASVPGDPLSVLSLTPVLTRSPRRSVAKPPLELPRGTTTAPGFVTGGEEYAASGTLPPRTATSGAVGVRRCFFNATTTAEIYTLSLHDAQPEVL